MLTTHATEVLAHQHIAELHADAAARRQRNALHRDRRRPSLRVRMGWMLVTAGLRLALRDRPAPTARGVPPKALTLRRS